MHRDTYLRMTLDQLLAACTQKPATTGYTISGTVKDNSNKAVVGAEVTLIKENKSTVTDKSGKFTIHEDENVEPPPIGIFASSTTPGFISINSGILSKRAVPRSISGRGTSLPVFLNTPPSLF